MGYAICISCGASKRRAFATCKHCGYAPRADNVAMAKSLMLSTQWIDENGQPCMSDAQLRHIQAQILSGVWPALDETELARLVKEKDSWDHVAHVSWWRVIFLVLTILSIPAALFAIGWWLSHMR